MVDHGVQCTKMTMLDHGWYNVPKYVDHVRPWLVQSIKMQKLVDYVPTMVNLKIDVFFYGFSEVCKCQVKKILSSLTFKLKF